MCILKLVNDLKEAFQCFRITIWQICIFKNIPEELRDAGVCVHLSDCFAIKVQQFMSTLPRIKYFPPGVLSIFTTKECSLSPKLFSLHVHVVHELVDKCNGYLFNLAFRVRNLSYKYIACSIDPVFCYAIKHND